MHDSSISANRLATVSLWVLSLITFGVSWVVWLAGRQSLGLMIGTSAVIVVAAAGISQVRGYSLRICGLLRVAYSFDEESSVQRLRPLR